MKQWKQKLTTYTERTSKRMTYKWKKTAALIIASSFIVGGATSAFAETDKADLYYVYIGDQFVGTVDNPQVIENIVTDELEEQGKSYEGIQTALANELSYLPEDEGEALNEVNFRKCPKRPFG